MFPTPTFAKPRARDINGRPPASFTSRSGFPAPSFNALFADSGAGAVSLALNGGTGAATFTRATSATCWGSTGLLLTVGTGVARSTYTELTGATYLGYLAEEARTNNMIQNRDFTNAAWTATTMTVAKDQTGIDGAATAASSLLATAGNATVAQTVTIAAVNRPFSVYVKRITGTGNIDLAQDGASFTTQSVASDGLWHRCTLVASQLNPVLTIRLVTNGDKIAVDYAMLEDKGGAAATFPLSPIATTTVAVTRNTDVLSFPTAGNFLNTAGSCYAEIMAPNATSNPRIVSAGAGSGEPLILGGNPPTTVSMIDGGVALNGIAFAPSAAVQKVASRWAGSVSNTFLAGVKSANLAFDGNLNGPGPLAIGVRIDPTLSLNGTIKNVKLWTVALTDAQIASL